MDSSSANLGVDSSRIDRLNGSLGRWDGNGTLQCGWGDAVKGDPNDATHTTVAMEKYILETKGLSHHFGKQSILTNPTLGYPRGSIFGFLGPNGAGKTTTLRLILGLRCGSSRGRSGFPPGKSYRTSPHQDTRQSRLAHRNNLLCMPTLAASKTCHNL